MAFLGRGAMGSEEEQEHRAQQARIKEEYRAFLDDAADRKVYSKKVEQLIRDSKVRLVVNVNDLRAFSPGRCASLLKETSVELRALQAALTDLITREDDGYAKKHEAFLIGLCGSFGGRHVSPRSLSSRLLGGVVCVEGIVTKMSLVRPKIVRSVHYAPKTGKSLERRYLDEMGGSVAGAGRGASAYPTKDDEGNPLETEYGLCVFKDHQTFTIQELPEKAPPGQLPRSVEVVVEDDLVDACKPGDRVLVVGTYRVINNQRQGFFSGSFRTIILANAIIEQVHEAGPTFTPHDVRQIRHFSRQTDIFETLTKAIAPSIYGHHYVKQAILCLLLGGIEKILPNGSRLRGDINLLLIGDPSVAKSQMLRFVLQIAAIAVATTGRGSSGVGLTAAVTTDETGDRRLEAGAMVLADRGVVCIDEFDKMADEDRTAIHEVMEQGRVTISKAGIHAKLNARCSVLAAANPVYGRYDPFKSPVDNIGMPDSLLSRFDLIFVMTDKADQETDLILADHVVRIHRYRAPGELDGEASRLNTGIEWLSTNSADPDEPDNRRKEVWEKYDPILHGTQRSQEDRVLSRDFLRKYLTLAREARPVLSDEACQLIAEEYTKLRSQDRESEGVARTQPVTARCLETLIRLATAHAKVRLQKKVLKEDAQAACDMVHFAYFKKVEKRKKKRTLEEQNENAPAMDQDVDDEREDAADDPYRFGSSEPTPKRSLGPNVVPAAPRSAAAAAPIISDHKYQMFRQLISRVFDEKHQTTLPQETIVDFVGRNSGALLFTTFETDAGFAKLCDEGKIMMADGQVFLV